MTEDLALQLIKVNDHEDRADAWDHYFFHIKHEILQTPFVSQLIRIKLKKVNQLLDIESTLFNTTETVSQKPESTERLTFSDILSRQSQLKLNIHQASNASDLLSAVIQYDHLAVQYAHYIYHKIKPYPQKEKQVSLREIADIMDVLKELKELEGLEAEGIKNLGKFEADFPNLWHEFQRVSKGIHKELIA